MAASGVETLRKPSTGLKPVALCWIVCHVGVETLRKPSTGLKRSQYAGSPVQNGQVETLRKPSTGLKPTDGVFLAVGGFGRDTQKTQHGIETRTPDAAVPHEPGRDTQKTQHGIETRTRLATSATSAWVETLRKPSTGLKPYAVWDLPATTTASRHSENPARD